MRRVLITRAPHQASALAEALRECGCEPVLVPAIEIAPPTSTCALDASIASVTSFDWLIFTSANAVQAFAERYLALQGRAFRPSVKYLEEGGCLIPTEGRPLVAAIGPATARAVVQHLEAEPSVVPQQAVAESFAEALLPYALQADRTSTRFLLIRAESAREYLPDTLRMAGAEVDIVAAYCTVIPSSSVEAVRTLFRDAAPDAIAFTSSSTATNFRALMEAAGVALPEATRRISIGPITSQTMRELGMAPHAEAAEANVASLAAAVASALRRS
jgi:uroporphyrinogen-III synthase